MCHTLAEAEENPYLYLSFGSIYCRTIVDSDRYLTSFANLHFFHIVNHFPTLLTCVYQKSNERSRYLVF